MTAPARQGTSRAACQVGVAVHACLAVQGSDVPPEALEAPPGDTAAREQLVGPLGLVLVLSGAIVPAALGAQAPGLLTGL